MYYGNIHGFTWWLNDTVVSFLEITSLSTNKDVVNIPGQHYAYRCPVNLRWQGIYRDDFDFAKCYWVHWVPLNTWDICNVWKNKVQSFNYFIQCRNCLITFYVACTNLKRDELMSHMWCCPCYPQNIFVYNQLDDHDVYWAISEGLSEWGFILHEINKKVFILFEIINSPNTPLF